MTQRVSVPRVLEIRKSLGLHPGITSELNITLRSPKEGNNVSATQPKRGPNIVWLKTLNDIYLDRTKHKERLDTKLFAVVIH
jgi:hypothetical protein